MSLLVERMADPVHMGPLDGATGSGAIGNPACGDVVTVHVRVEDDVIVAASFESMGSAYQLATASVLVDCITGQRVDEALERTPTCVLKRLPDLPESKQYLGRLAIDAMRRALQDHLAGGRRPEAGDERILDPEAAQAEVLRLLANGRQWGTREIEAMVQAEGHRLADEPVRFLAALRREGVIEGEMDVGARSWRWWSRGADAASG